MKTFVSYAHADEAKANESVDFLRLHYVDFFLAHRSMKGGYFKEQIQSEIRDCHKFIVLISPAALESQWVRDEVQWAMECEHLRGNILPVLIEPTPDWKTLHEHIERLQLFDLTTNRERTLTKIVEEEYNRPRHRHSYYRVGDVQIQVLIFAGGNGQTQYRDGDILCDGPTDDRQFSLPPDIAVAADERIAEVKAACEAKGALFVNNRQVRLWDYSFGSASDSGGLSDKPMRLQLGWTEYYQTRLTNQSRDHILPCGNSIALKYGRDLEDFSESGLSNPIAVNMTVVTSDGMIYLATRGKKVAWNPGELQPAVSGDGQPEDLNEASVYDPFRTAIREAQEECVGSYPVTRDQVTFFGLARTMGTQFPFLFGEIRLPITSKQLQGYPPLNPFEGQPVPIEFTVESACDFVRKHHLDHYDGRRGGVIGTTLFSLLQSLHYEYPDRWHEVIERLSSKP